MTSRKLKIDFFRTSKYKKERAKGEAKNEVANCHRG